MIVERQRRGFSFYLAIPGEPMAVDLYLDEGEGEELRLLTEGGDPLLPPIPMRPGSVRSILGPRRWKDFLLLRKAGQDCFFLESAPA